MVGNIEGDLAVFKGDHSQPWKKASKLGMVCVFIIYCLQCFSVANLIDHPVFENID